MLSRPPAFFTQFGKHGQCFGGIDAAVCTRVEPLDGGALSPGMAVEGINPTLAALRGLRRLWRQRLESADLGILRTFGAENA